MNVWKPVEGAANTQIAALIHKPSITNSNAYLLRTPDRLVIIDPGAEPAQVEQLNSLIAQVLEEAPREVILLLTHAHLDHFAAVEGLRVATGRPRTFLHAAGARAIREKDVHHTLAFLYPGARVPDLVVDGAFFGPASGKDIARRREPGPDGVPITVEWLALGPDIALDIYETPGHSPCSCTFRVGRHLIIGDVLFGANPGLAGLIGWNSEDLARSARLIRHLIGCHDMVTCWTGHGGAVPQAVALKMLSGLEGQLSTLGKVAVIDQDRVSLLRLFAIELLHEIERLLTLIGARLMVVAHHLENMEENAAAARLMASLDLDGLELQLTEFREFCQEFERGEQPGLSVAMKAGTTMARVRSAIADHKEDGIAVFSPVGRAEHLIDTFLQTLRGLTFQMDLVRIDFTELVASVVGHEQSPYSSAECFLAASENEDAFRRLLIGNLAASSVLRDREIIVRQAARTDGTWDGTVTTDVRRFHTVLVPTLEMMAAGVGVGRIDIFLGNERGRPTLRVSREGPLCIVPPVRAALYNRAMEQIGGAYRVEQGDVLISLEAADPSLA